MINPDCPIPPFVQKLTGIKQRDVQGAPRFHEVAKRIVQMTEGAIFVAHNAPFDYRVLREEFARLGYDYQRTVLDTIPLAQKFIPDLPAYGLATLCEELGITNAKRHRADGDARATVKLLEILLEKDREKYIEGVYLKQPSATGKHPLARLQHPQRQVQPTLRGLSRGKRGWRNSVGPAGHSPRATYPPSQGPRRGLRPVGAPRRSWRPFPGDHRPAQTHRRRRQGDARPRL
ncbi:MAG: hypothetical protein EBZ31_03680 [Flavobacteriia bacterium]|nr:hypothetical protein [Flavobacteriia bacterium]